MDNTILKKKLSTYLTETGRLQGVPDDILHELLSAWEKWSVESRDFYKSIGFPSSQLAFLMGKAKKLKREGRFPVEDFKEFRIDGIDGTGPGSATSATSVTCPIELFWEKGRVIRFREVDLLVDFLKKVA